MAIVFNNLSAGGSKLYRHILYYPSETGETLEVISTESEPFTKETFVAWLKSKGHTNKNTALPFYRVTFVNDKLQLYTSIYASGTLIMIGYTQYIFKIEENVLSFTRQGEYDSAWNFTTDTVTEL